jgi:hypothetical protein
MQYTDQKIIDRFIHTRDDVAACAADIVKDLAHDVYLYNTGQCDGMPSTFSKLDYYQRRVAELRVLYALIDVRDRPSIPFSKHFLELDIVLKKDGEYV